MRIDAPSITGSFTLGTVTLPDGAALATTGSNTFVGNQTINGTIVATGTTLVSSSVQILSGTTIHSGSFFNGISVVSGSAQVDVMSTTNIARLATTGSNTLQGTQTINGSLVVTGSLTAQQFIVSSSVTYLTESFASGSHKFGDSSDDTHQFTGSMLLTGSLNMNSGALYVTGTYVGIGTTSIINANAKLEVKGDIFLTPTASVASKLHLYNNDSTNETYIYDSGSSSTSILTFAPGGATMFTINSNTSKAIISADLTAGTSTYRTTIQGASSGASVRFGTLATSDYLGKIGTYASAFNIDSSNGPISFQFAAVEKASLSASGTFKAIQYRIAPNAVDNVYFIVDSDNTYTGQLSIQAGGGSAGYGGSLLVYGHSHASRAGYVSAGISSGSGGKFTVMTAGNGSGSDVFTVNTSGDIVASGTITASSRSFHNDTATFGSNGLWQQSISGTRFNGYNGYSVVHIKTSIRHDSACMISFNIRGFWYGPQSIDTDIQFYCYAGTGTLYGFGVYEKAETSWDYGGYYSSDDYVVLWVSGLNNYAGFSLNANNTSLIQHGTVSVSAWTKANTTSAQY